MAALNLSIRAAAPDATGLAVHPLHSRALVRTFTRPFRAFIVGLWTRRKLLWKSKIAWDFIFEPPRR
jgi:hypothetical protein